MILPFQPTSSTFGTMSNTDQQTGAASTVTTAPTTSTTTASASGSRTLNLNKDPPSLKDSKNYDDWVKLLEAWKEYTTVPKEKQGLALLLSLKDEAQDAVLELSREELYCEAGIDNCIKKLDNLFKRDDVLKRFGALDEFETYKRLDSTSMQKLSLIHI